MSREVNSESYVTPSPDALTKLTADIRRCADDLRPGCALYSGLSMCIRLDMIADELAAFADGQRPGALHPLDPTQR